MVSNKKDKRIKSKAELIAEEDDDNVDPSEGNMDALFDNAYVSVSKSLKKAKKALIEEAPDDDDDEVPFTSTMDTIMLLFNFYKELNSQEGIDKSIPEELALKIVEKIRML